MSSTVLVKNVDTSNTHESESLPNSVKHEIDEIFHVRKEPVLEESIPNESYNEESKYIIDQIIDENNKVWSKEYFLTTWNSHSVKIETSKNCFAGNDSTVHTVSKHIKKELCEMKVGEIMEGLYLIRDKNHMQNENAECTMSENEDVSEMRSTIQLKLTQEKCDPASMEFINSVFISSNKDIDAYEERKYITPQIIDKNGMACPRKSFLKSCNLHSVKMDIREDVISKTDCTTNNKKDVSEMLSPIQMETNSPRCDDPMNLDCIHLKLKCHKCYSCHLCDFSSSTKVALQMHIKSVHLECSYCRSHSANLQKHINSKHLKLKNHQCHSCNYSSLYKGDITKHIKSVHPKLRNFKCNLCDYSAEQKGNLQCHIKSIHLKMKDQKCHLCNYSTSHSTTLQIHIKSIHLKLKAHKCHICDYSSTQIGALQSHIKSIHLKLRDHKCHLCNYSAAQKVNLQTHIKSIHLKLKTFKCHICDYSSSQKGALHSHIKSIHSKPNDHKFHLCD